MQALATLLTEAVESGAAVSFLLPLPRGTAADWWRGVLASGERDGRTRVLVARRAGNIVGTVTLHRAWAPNQPHRGEIAKLLVQQHEQRSGLGEALMLAAEAEACSAGLTLLTLDAKAGGAAERLYRRLGWVLAGSIPRFALDPHGSAHHDAVIYWKALGGQLGGDPVDSEKGRTG